MSADSGINKLFVPMLIVASVIFIFVLQFGFIFLLIALLPSAVAYFIDQNHGKPAFKIVLLCNLAATLPSLIPMLRAAMRMERPNVMEVMSDPRVWLLIYSGAAAGWCLVYLCRYIGRFITILYFEYQVSALERFQKKLLAEWGDKIIEK